MVNDEAYEAKRDGATLQKNSGRGWRQKGDAKWGRWLVDYKNTKRSFTLNRKVWSKIATDAFVERMDPVLKVIFEEEGERPLRLAVLDWEEFKRLKEIEEKYEEV